MSAKRNLNYKRKPLSEAEIDKLINGEKPKTDDAYHKRMMEQWSGGEEAACFAYKCVNGRASCRALNLMVCQKQPCPFFKMRDREDAELMQINRTTNIDRICFDYSHKR